MTPGELTRVAYGLRMDVLDIIYRTKSGHIGGGFSAMDILAALYFKHLNVSPETMNAPGRDRFLLSKGHAAEALYATLAARGFFPKERLEEIGRFGGDFIGHPNNKIPGVEMNTGSLGHGLSLGVGMALALRDDHPGARAWVLMGDGELAEGSNWEAAMAAGHYRLHNLIAIVDRNGLQISGSTEDVMAAEPLDERFGTFGWRVIRTDGNDMRALDAAFAEAKRPLGKPVMMIAETTKGKGVSYMENEAKWHHGVPDERQFEQARRELARGGEDDEYYS